MRHITYLMLMCALMAIAGTSHALNNELIELVSSTTPVVTDLENKCVLVHGVTQTQSFRLCGDLPEFDILGNKYSKSAECSLFNTNASKDDIYYELTKLEMGPGDNLDEKTWKKRDSDRSRAARTLMAGAPLRIMVYFKGYSFVKPLVSLVKIPEGQDISFVFGGNIELSHKIGRGSIISLYSSPSAIIGNSKAPIGLYDNQDDRFRIIEGAFPPDGTEVVLIIGKGE